MGMFGVGDVGGGIEKHRESADSLYHDPLANSSAHHRLCGVSREDASKYPTFDVHDLGDVRAGKPSWGEPAQAVEHVISQHAPELTVVAPLHYDLQDHSFGFGRVTDVHFTQNVCALVGNHGAIDIRSHYTVAEVHLDINTLAEILHQTAGDALDTFIANPESRGALRKFQRRLPGEELSPPEHQSESHRAAADVAVTMLRCDIGVIGNHNEVVVESGHHAPTGELPIFHILRENDDAAIAFARCCTCPDDQAAQREFNRVAARAVTADALHHLLGSADFSGGQTTVHKWWGSAHVQGAVGASIGQGNSIRSSIAIRAHKVRPIDHLALGTILDDIDLPSADNEDQSATAPYLNPSITVLSIADETHRLNEHHRILEETERSLRLARQLADEQHQHCVQEADQIRRERKRAERCTTIYTDESPDAT